MIFLIEYNRSEGRIVAFREFDDRQRREAEDARLQIEVKGNGKEVDCEVVLLEAKNEDALRVTHRRYFEDLRQITAAAVYDRRQPGMVLPGTSASCRLAHEQGAAVRLPPPRCIASVKDDNRLPLLPGCLQRRVRAAGDVNGHVQHGVAAGGGKLTVDRLGRDAVANTVALHRNEYVGFHADAGIGVAVG